ncbi:MAG TPA: M43 family zinc metalloprotease [Chryseolinea sp.]|nr:M43 family zinc metalloprotease [Flavobacteriales bacterium]HPH46828.1 M43 family zinc metalloprotease [Chryseolinea sp.]HPM31760.1 M43 family zinc metalloprotease [Chryseolinea sp.]
MGLRLALFFCLFTGFVTLSNAQQTPVDPPRTCATMEQDSVNKLKYPRRSTLDDFEEAIQQRMKEIQAREIASGRKQSTLLSIPIVVHIIHNGEAIGSGTNISKAQVQAQIDVLNEDFRRKPGTPGFNNSPVGADIEIEFCLSPVDQNGIALSEPGIHRFNGNKSSWTREEIEGGLKSSTIWNPNLFYNIWTVRFGGTSSNLLGYAQFPDQSGLSGLNESGGSASTDGVVVQYSSFGSADKGSFPVMQAPYNKGRTLSHETGHWLGLRHIWGDGNCADDFVSDTPPAASASSGCPVGRVSCGATNMVENYMDYTNDACMNIFTIGQKTRIRAVMDLSPRRKSLLAANLCSPIVADIPTPNFTADKQLVLLGGEVNFTDLSTNFPNAWSWTFEGGNPSASIERNPKVKYTIPGIYKVTLSASNSLGTSAPLEIDSYITVSEEGLCGSATNFSESYTPSTIQLSDYGIYTGYLTGHNSLKSKGISEIFTNALGYEYISGMNITFSHVYSTSEDATVTVVVWNARGPQSAPGSVIERKVVLLKQIQEDIENNRATTIVLDRESPVFGKPFHVGIELNYDGDSLAIQSSLDGESTKATSWIQNEAGVWHPYAIDFGANIAMNIEPIIGMNPSVQVSASKQLIYPGEEVTLNGRGASIFVWSTDDGAVQDYTGPQLIIQPTTSTIVTTNGSGLELCNNVAYTTIYIREDITGTEDDLLSNSIMLYPNPGQGNLNIVMENNFLGDVNLSLVSVIGNEVLQPITMKKGEEKLEHNINTSTLQTGIYFVKVRLEGRTIVKKWFKN